MVSQLMKHREGVERGFRNTVFSKETKAAIERVRTTPCSSKTSENDQLLMDSARPIRRDLCLVLGLEDAAGRTART